MISIFSRKSETSSSDSEETVIEDVSALNIEVPSSYKEAISHHQRQ